ncbi:CorA metal ion transporter [Coemansia sp. RSA 552]|nr:CorA metal ion transporter [Coemansia sp. RSA 552]
MEPGSPEAQPESTGSCVYEADNEKAEGLGLQTESRPSSQARARRLKHAGATQYTPATLSKKSTIARAAPGLSYMFSPPVGGSGPASGSSRPPSVMGSITGGAMPAAHPPLHYTQTQQVPPLRPQALGEVQRTLSQEDMGAEDIRHTGTRRSSSGSQQQQPTSDTTPRGERKMYGSINVGALELFLEDGKVPDTSSDEECSGFSNDDFGWEENYSASGASSVYRNSLGRDPRPMSALQDQIRKHSSLDERDFGTVSPQRQSPGLRANQFSPRIRSYGRSGTPDEHMPLLNQHQPPSYGTEPVEFIVPADMQGPLGAPSLQQGRQQRRRKSRRRQNHENLFLDKDGFIDESYRFTFFNPALGTIRAQEFADLRTPTMDLAALLQAGGCFWIDVLRPSFQEMHLLSKIFGIHALTVEDIMTQDSREKCEIHAHYYFVCFRSFDNDPSSETYLEPKCIYNIVLREGIITFHMDPSVHQYHVLRRIRRQIDHIVVTPDWLNYAIIDEITDLLAPVWHSIEFDVDAIDELVLVISSSEQSDMLLRISTVRKRIMMATRLLQGKPDVVRALIKRFESATAFNTTQMNAIAGSVPMPVVDRQPGSTAWSSESPQIRAAAIPNDSVAIDMAMDQRKGQETLLYLGDVLDHIVTMMQNATHYDNMLGRAQSNYLAQVSVELTRSSDYTNDVVAKLSALAAVVMPLQICSGLWGMNVKVPGQDRDDLWDFFIILGLLLAYVGIAVTWARRRGIF